MYYLFSCSSDGKSVALAHVLKVFFSPYMMDTVGVAKLEVVSTGFYLKMIWEMAYLEIPVEPFGFVVFWCWELDKPPLSPDRSQLE